ncbi:MAG: threonine ammonia-lyase [Deltaproteobacteria bacterium]|nr:threonine ammonia-lyase [Deltaproteobacteria bacterium]
MSLPISYKDVTDALVRIRKGLPITPVTQSLLFSEISGREVFIKWDNKFRSGAFKERGALNFLSALEPEQRKSGVCAASAGNHAQGVSLHAQSLQIPTTIVMPIYAPLVKIQAVERAGAEVVLEGENFDESLAYCLEVEKPKGKILIHAFDDPWIMAGQGTSALEILDQVPDLDSIIVPIGGGGLISGIATAIKHQKPDVYVLGVQSQWAKSGGPKKSSNKLGPFTTTIADGIAVKTIGSLNRQVIDALVDDVVTVTEDDIARAIVKYLEAEKTVVEGAGAAALAALLANALPARYKRTVLLACGSNIDMNLLSTLIQRDLVERGRWLRYTISVPDRPGLLSSISGLLASESANIMDVRHNRFAAIPGHVEMEFLVEVRNADHGKKILKMFADKGVTVVESN